MMLCLLLVLLNGMPTSFLNNKVTHFFTCQRFLLSKKLFEKQLGPKCPICNLVLTFISNSSVHILFFQLKAVQPQFFSNLQFGPDFLFFIFFLSQMQFNSHFFFFQFLFLLYIYKTNQTLH